MTEEIEYSGEFTYEVPDSQKFLRGIIAFLKSRGETEIAELLNGCKCSIVPSSQFSRRRWNEFYTVVYIQTPITKLDLFTEAILAKICDACDIVMPKEAGYAVMDVKTSPLLDDFPDEKSLTEDLEDISAELSQKIISILPEDIKNKGKEMAEVYLYVYCVENSLRLFIEEVAKKQYGDDYFSKLSIPKSVQKGIEIRKKEEESQHWLRIRGSSDIFYLDFIDLGAIIQNNWDLFKDYFPNQGWILSKIEEIARCRHLIAHNSYIGNDEKELIKVYYRNILRQIIAKKA